jgi:hypothetical protein
MTTSAAAPSYFRWEGKICDIVVGGEFNEHFANLAYF